MRYLVVWLLMTGGLLAEHAHATVLSTGESRTESSRNIETVDGSITGAWYDPLFDGSGFLIEVIPGDIATVYWFTYDADGNQQWFIGIGNIIGSQIVVDDLLKTSGGVFGDNFDPDSVVLTSVGEMVFDFSDCDTATVDFTVSAVSGTQSLQRLTGIDGRDCNTSAPDEEYRDQLNQTGSWYNTGRSGEGFIVQILAEQRALVVWFTYDPDGNQAWFIGIGHISADYVHVNQMDVTMGGRFGPDHDPTAVQRTPWGSVELALGCNQGQTGYDAIETAYGSGQYPLTRLTLIEGLDCFQDEFHSMALGDLPGSWRSDGFGSVIQITDSDASIFEITAASCILVDRVPFAEIEDFTVMVNNENDRLEFPLLLGTTTPVYFDRINNLPVRCENDGTDTTSDPLHNFDVFWATYNELYAAFELRGVDWDQQFATYSPMVTALTSDDELFQIFSDMLDPLDDGHVGLESPTQSFNTRSSPERSALLAVATRPEVGEVIVNHYLDGQDLNTAFGRIRYGVIDVSVGYMELRRFSGFLPDSEEDEEMDFFRQQLDVVLDFFAQEGVDSVIIDLRRNGGGNGRFANELAGRFARGRTRLAYSERRPNEQGLTPSFPVTVAPTPGTAFNGPVVLLTSMFTASAAEAFGLYLRVMPHATLVGEHTSGVITSSNERFLPNGWIVTFAAGLSVAPDGEIFEASGIPPDIMVENFLQIDSDNNRDSAIDTALELLTAVLGQLD